MTKAVAPQAKAPKWYSGDDVKPKAAPQKHNPTKLRSTITPGTILILLSGRFRGKRVVFLKQLPSGTLLVTGPYSVNGVPMRRVNQAYVIATSMSVDVSKVTIPAADDSYFTREEVATKTDEDQFFEQGAKSSTVSDKRKADQKTVDAGVLAAMTNPMLKAYLNAKFSLKKGDRPHEMIF
ncbi:unnamed protein product [Ectocarpus sp. 4 AP-2014]|uniref:60S ribosomal protein L6 n=1 Tax=Ectocarpus siliculosus TaxID=2880 RepID=D7G468_ECTSI|nr:conserved unknown protein [Ectocarpus siliculosus]|eukprot:CBJ27083.1 conserved unknown protein [Ectocarpus siliculosus]